MAILLSLLVAALCCTAGVEALSKELRIGSGGRTINDFRREAAAEANTLSRRQIPDAESLYEAYTVDIPIDHFQDSPRYEPHATGTFKNRYWFDASYYKPGGPVIVLQSGETNGIGRLPFLQKGIVYLLAKATGGIGVILEHRYYGRSMPFSDLSTEHLRFLTTEQALADEAYFAQNVQFPGLEDQDLTSASTAYISYGGSYAGAFSAFLRVVYPDTFWGSISSSGVTKALYEFWQYYDPVTQYGPPFCIATQQLFIDIVDNILIGKDDPGLTAELKSAFGMPNVTYDADFANQLAQGVGYWQSLNWDPEVGDSTFYEYCNDITSLDVKYPRTESSRSTAEYLIEQGGYTANETVVNQMLNYIGWINANVVQPCAEEGVSQDVCFSNLNATYYEQDGRDQSEWRSWAYQYCTEWGYLQTGSGVPADRMPVISRTIDLNYTTYVCRAAFEVDEPSQVDLVNKYGGYGINYSRLAFVDGAWDPWRPVTPHGFKYGAPHRISTVDEPFILIPKALHHYDENGRFPNESTPLLPPEEVKNSQILEELFVKEWMDEWNASR